VTTRADERRLILILAGVQFTNIMDFMVLMPLGPQLMRVMHIGPREFSFLVAAYTLSASTAAFLTGLYIDRFDRRRALIFLYTGFALSTLLCGLATGFATLLAGRMLAGVFGGVCGAAVFAVIGDAVAQERRGSATGTVSMAFAISAIAGVPAGLFLASAFGWRAPFLLLVVLSLLILTGIVRFVPPLRGHVDASSRDASPLHRLRSILRDANHRWALALPATMVFGGFSIIPFLSPYAVANVGLKETDLPYIYLFGGLATAFTSRYIGRLSDRHGKRETFAVVAGLSVFPILIVTNLPPVPVWVLVACTTLFTVLISGRVVPAMALVTASAQPRVRGGLMSFNSALTHLSSGLASLSAGRIIGQAETGALTRYWAVGLIAVVCTLLAIRISRRIKAVS
jgi:predicted MFS family arabinose efflux permease